MPMPRGENGMRRGNPIMLTAPARDLVVSGGVNLGCRGLLEQRPDLVHIYPTTSDGYLIDSDTIGAHAAIFGDSLPASVSRPVVAPFPTE